jgi:hypothetical protein
MASANTWSGGCFEYRVAKLRRNIVLEIKRFRMLALTLDVRVKIRKRIWGRGLPTFSRLHEFLTIKPPVARGTPLASKSPDVRGSPSPYIVTPPERMSSVCFQASPTKSFLTLFLFYIPESFLEPGASRDMVICASLEGIKAANMRSTELDNLSRGGTVDSHRPLISCSIERFSTCDTSIP